MENDRMNGRMRAAEWRAMREVDGRRLKDGDDGVKLKETEWLSGG